MPTTSTQTGKHDNPHRGQDGLTAASRSLSLPLQSSIACYATHRATQIARMMNAGQGACNRADMQ
jgi:hypothetical protein